MAIDVLILNTAVLDLRSPDFSFVDQQVGPGGLAKCPTAEMPNYSQAQIKHYIEQAGASAGGPGNTAPLQAKANLNVAVGAFLGKGEFDGMDIQGRVFHDRLENAGVDMSACEIHPSLPTGTAFIHETPSDERGGIAYFPNANDDFDFDTFKPHVERLAPKVVYYMYSGLSERGDANRGRDLADFIRWCREEQGAITIVDSHTLTGNPGELIAKCTPVPAYKLLTPLLPELDIFFTSGDEAKMIVNTLEGSRGWDTFSTEENLKYCLNFLVDRYAPDTGMARLFGITVSDGALVMYKSPGGAKPAPRKCVSPYMEGEVVDLVGAGDSFRAGLIGYVARNAGAFHDGQINVAEAVQMGNLMASLYIKSPLKDRYGAIKPYDDMLETVRRNARS